MKTIFTFLMVLVCLTSFTAGATTTKPEQKQKTELVKEFPFQANAVSVENDYQVAFEFSDATIKTEFEVKSFDGIKPITLQATNTDVGWRSSRINYSQYSNSNLPEINRIPFNLDFHKRGKAKIRYDC